MELKAEERSFGGYHNMLQNAGISIPAWISPCLERPSYTNASRPSLQSVCLSRSQSYSPPVRFLEDTICSPNEGNYPSFLPELQSRRGLPLSSWMSWHQRQNLPFLAGHPYRGDSLTYHACGINDLITSEDPQSCPQKRKRARTTFSAEQLKKLEKRFHGNHYIVGDERLKISKDLNLSEAQVKVWFQNRRIKYKREQELEKLGLKKKLKGEHHVKRWQVITRNFGPDSNDSKDLF